MKSINVLSLFDGISCCHLALDRANIPINTYYASEIEKKAMQVTMTHFPDTIQLGDVEKWKDWNIDWNSIDLVTFGSPCFSVGTLITTQYGYKLIEDIKPGDVVKTHTGEYHKVVSAGSKIAEVVTLNATDNIFKTIVTLNHPYYTKDKKGKISWTSVCNLKEDMQIACFDPKETNIKWVDYKGYISEHKYTVVYNLEVEKDHSYIANNAVVHNCQGFSAAGKGLNFEDPRSKLFFVAVDILNYLREVNPNIKFLMENVKMKKEWEDIITSYLGVDPIFINSRVVSAQDRKRLYWCNWNVAPIKERDVGFSDICEDGWFAGAMRGRRINSKGSRCDYDKSIPIVQQIECRKDNKINCCTTVSKDNVAVPIKRERQPAKESEWRYLTPKEYERAQTLPDDYTACIKSSHKRRALCGLGWTVDVIAHIFNSYKRELLSPHQSQDVVGDKNSNHNI